MAGDLKLKYGTTNQTITITLNSLAASATVGRQSDVVNNRTNLFTDVLVQCKFTFATGTAGSGKKVDIYAFGTADDTNFGAEYIATGAGNQKTIGTTDAAYTVASPSGLLLLYSQPVPFVASATDNAVWITPPLSLARAFGSMPAQWGIVVVADANVNLHSSGNSAWYQGVYGQYT